MGGRLKSNGLAPYNSQRKGRILSRLDWSSLLIQRQAAAVRMFLRFYQLSILACGQPLLS